MWEAAEIDGRIYRARDSETGAFMELRSTPEIDVQRAIVRFPSEPELNFELTYEPKLGGNLGSSSNIPNVKLNIRSFQNLVKKRSRTFEENTEFVRYLIQGLATINRKWPIFKDPNFYSNLSEYKAKNIPVTEFDFPSDDELALLSIRK